MKNQHTEQSHTDIWLHNLPAYGSPTFWRYLEQPEVPPEVLVRLYRRGSTEGDHGENTPERQQLLALILLRQRERNISWARATVRKYCGRRPLEQTMLTEDLLADLEEEICRAFINSLRTQRFFWELNFTGGLAYARRRVRRSFLVREGHWFNLQVTQGRRVPRDLTCSIDRQAHMNNEMGTLNIEDEKMYTSLLQVELSDLFAYIEKLPQNQRDIIECIFWQDCTEKDTAQQLGISDRTVRNQLHKACAHLSRDLYEFMFGD